MNTEDDLFNKLRQTPFSLLERNSILGHLRNPKGVINAAKVIKSQGWTWGEYAYEADLDFKKSGDLDLSNFDTEIVMYLMIGTEDDTQMDI